MSINIVNKIGNAAKWSTVTELFTKLIVPITNMILARLLAPEAFGVVTMVTMVISFTDMLTDAGFQKYLIQHEFNDDDEKEKNTNVAFWTNFTISLFLWAVIITFRHPIANALGNSDLGNVIAIACVQIPLTSFSSIQMALYRRDFDFKTLFKVRIVGALIPLITTVPLAFIGFGYWSIIIGSICGVMSNAIILTVNSKWKPSFFYSFGILKEMLAFSVWSLFEAIAIWLTAWIDVLIIGAVLSDYHLGLYQNSLNMVNSLMAIITASITPILFSALSRLQNDEDAFISTFLSMHKIIAYLVFPIGVGVFLYRDLATNVMLGSQWIEASNIIGVWALTSAVRIVMTSTFSEAYRAKGKPKLSLFLQLIDLVFLVPTCIISVQYGFWSLVFARAFLRFDLIVPGLIVMGTIIHISSRKILENISRPLMCTAIMTMGALGLKSISNLSWWSIVSIGLCVVVYFISLLLIDKDVASFFLKYIKITKRNLY